MHPPKPQPKSISIPTYDEEFSALNSEISKILKQLFTLSTKIDTTSDKANQISSFLDNLSKSYYKTMTTLTHQDNSSNEKLEKLSALVGNSLLHQLNSQLFMVNNAITILENKIAAQKNNIELLQANTFLSNPKSQKNEVQIENRLLHLKTLEKRFVDYKLERMKIIEQIDKVEKLLKENLNSLEGDLIEDVEGMDELLGYNENEYQTQQNTLQLLELFRNQLNNIAVGE